MVKPDTIYMSSNSRSCETEFNPYAYCLLSCRDLSPTPIDFQVSAKPLWSCQGPRNKHERINVMQKSTILICRHAKWECHSLKVKILSEKFGLLVNCKLKQLWSLRRSCDLEAQGHRTRKDYILYVDYLDSKLDGHCLKSFWNNPTFIHDFHRLRSCVSFSGSQAQYN